MGSRFKGSRVHGSGFTVHGLRLLGYSTGLVHIVRLKLFRLKAEGVRRARLPYFGGKI